MLKYSLHFSLSPGACTQESNLSTSTDDLPSLVSAAGSSPCTIMNTLTAICSNIGSNNTLVTRLTDRGPPAEHAVGCGP